MLKKSLSILLTLIMLLSVSFVAQAASVSWGSYTLYLPDSFTSCSPSSHIYTTGIEAGRTVHVWFFQHPGIMLGDVWGSGNIDVNFPYPTISGTMTFGARVDIYNADGTILVKLESQWTVTCTPPPPPGDEGCTPGYWKNHLEDWPATGYSPSADFDATFWVNLFNPNITLETAINLGGGGVNKLARHGTAALLSAAHPDVNYPYSVAQVIAYVQAGNVDPLVAANELGCNIP